MNIFSAASVGVGAVCLLLYLRPQEKEIAALIGICSAVLLFGGVWNRAAEALQTITRFAADSGFDDAVKTVLKALGIAALGQISADICREAGVPGTGAQLEQLAKIEILLLSLPLAAELIDLARGILG